MKFTRKNVWDLGGDWADTILWYARGVKAMNARALAEPTGWRFYGGIHGIDETLWKQLGYLTSSDKMPTNANQKRYWKQCQHGSWYFEPWHRGYLLALEANIRAEVIALKGPKDWALPYWNYFKPNQFKLPPAFASPDWPDGKGDNPLFIKQRYGPNNDGNVFVPIDQVNLDAMNDPDYAGVASGGSPGFGGVDTGFEHGGSVHGGIETQPHDFVHGLVGGSDPQNAKLPGLMSDPDTAALDPIFYLHHANLDRLWEVWRRNPPSHADPTEANWVKGPGKIGERIFSMPMPGDKPWDYTPGELQDLTKLDYTYDDFSAAAPAETPADRLRRLGITPTAAAQGVGAMSSKNVELVGANQGSLAIQGSETHTSVKLDAGVRSKINASLTTAAHGAPAPDRVFLNLENVRGLVDSTAFEVYVGLPDRANPKDHPELRAGSIALFGVRKASIRDGEHAGKGLTFVLEITKIVDALHLNNRLDVDALPVRIVPVRPVPADADVSIGRVSIFRQGK